MVLYEIYNHAIKCKYKTTICSRATIVILVINIFTFGLPFLLAYKVQGLWLKIDSYREQPEVHFKYEYFLMLETKIIDKPVICTTFRKLFEATEDWNNCHTIRVREEDYNQDGLNDKLYFHVEASLPPFQDVYKLTLILLFDYKLHSYSRLEMEAGGVVEAGTPVGGSRLELTGDLRLYQREPLRHKGAHLRYNVSLQDHLHTPSSFIRQYTHRNVTTRITNCYRWWTRGRSQQDPFILSLVLSYPEETVLYTPGFWQTAKMAWVQYLSLLFLSILLSKKLKYFILNNRLVHNIKVHPLKKPL